MKNRLKIFIIEIEKHLENIKIYMHLDQWQKSMDKM